MRCAQNVNESVIFTQIVTEVSLLFIITVSYKKHTFIIGYIGNKQQTRFSDDLFAQIYPHFKRLWYMWYSRL